MLSDQRHHEEFKRNGCNDADWMKFREIMQDQLSKLQAKQFFTTDVSGSRLYAAYLDGFLHESARSAHNCSACEHFIANYGNLVYFNSSSLQVSFWDPSWPGLPEMYKLSVLNMQHLVESADLTGVFYSPLKILGYPVTPPFYHLYATFEMSYLDAGHKSSVKKTDYQTVKHALNDSINSLRNVDQALELLRSGVLLRSEKFLPHAKWLCDLQKACCNAPTPKIKDEIIWRNVADAPDGFCHIRSSMLGTLLADIDINVPVQDLTKSFNHKMDPLHYQRAQVSPKQGNVDAMQKMILDKGLGTALERRFARLNEIEKIWEPVLQPPAYNVCEIKEDVISDVPLQTTLNPVRITWVKFLRTVLSQGVVDMEYFTTHTRNNFCAIVTSVHADAKPILQWDQDLTVENGPPVQRNPFSWYVWTNGAQPDQFGLKQNCWNKVSAVTLKPCMWFNGHFPHHGQGVVFILKEARESNPNGMGFFTEMLRSELHSVRSALEHHAQNHKIVDIEKGDAIGILLESSEMLLRVKMQNGTFAYLIDRYD
jgi:hypothetical protein